MNVYMFNIHSTYTYLYFFFDFYASHMQVRARKVDDWFRLLSQVCLCVCVCVRVYVCERVRERERKRERGEREREKKVDDWFGFSS